MRRELSKYLGWPAIVLLFCLVSGAARAQSRMLVGARNLAMGGTGVGSAGDAVAVFYNPAGMAFSEGWEFQLPLVTMDVEFEGDTLENLDELIRIFDQPGESLNEIQDRMNMGMPDEDDLEQLLDAFLDELPDLDTTEDGAAGRASAGPAFRWKNWGVSAYYSAGGGVDTLVDLTTGLSLSTGGLDAAIPEPVPQNTCGSDLVCQGFADRLVDDTGIGRPRAEVLVAASGNTLNEDPRSYEILTAIVDETISGGPTLADNPSQVNASGIVIGQAAFTYSRLIYRDKLSIGATAKIMSGRTYFRETRLADLEEIVDTYDDLFAEGASGDETELGIDLGVMYRPTPRWSFGLAGDNLTRPSFDLAGVPDSIELEPLFRAGAAYRPLRWFNVALDVDLNQISSGVIRGFEYRYANFGAEFLIGQWFFGRVGAYRNLAFDDAKTIYTGGVGFGVKRFSVELALGAAAERIELETVDYGLALPKGFAASLQLNWRPRREHRQL